MRAKRMRARASTDGVLRFPTGVFYHSQRSAPRLHACLRPSASAKLFCGHRNSTLRQHNSCAPRSSREYGPPRVVSQRSEEYELSMYLTVPNPIVSYFINKLSVTQMPRRFHRLTTSSTMRQCTRSTATLHLTSSIKFLDANAHRTREPAWSVPSEP